MRISDWSSDVCSSDLDRPTSDQIHRPCSAILHPCQSDTLALRQQHPVLESVKAPFDHREGGLVTIAMMFGPSHHHCQADRKRVVSGKSVSVRVDLGGRRIIKKKKPQQKKNKKP